MNILYRIFFLSFLSCCLSCHIIGEEPISNTDTDNEILLTTTIGAYPKPDYVSIPDWFQNEKTGDYDPAKAYNEFLLKEHEGLEEELLRGIKEVILAQTSNGIEIPTDGEVSRENYIFHHLRHLEGIDFNVLSKKVARKNWEGLFPTITGPVRAGSPFLPREYKRAQEQTDRPIKATLPGPMTITDTVADKYYNDEKKLAEDLAVALNQEILALVEAGCKWIQIDEPLFARKPEKALEFGIDSLDRCLQGVPDDVFTIVHICCGYPEHLDQEDFPKADSAAYVTLADALENSKIKAISIEDTHRRNDLFFLEKFKNTSILLGVIDISRSRIETKEEVVAHIESALEHIDGDRLFIAPDCGLGFLDDATAQAKLRNMTSAAREVREKLLRGGAAV